MLSVRYCQQLAGWLYGDIAVMLMTGVFLIIGLAVSSLLGGLVYWLLRRMGQTGSPVKVIAAEIAVGLVVGVVPFLLIVVRAS